MKYFCMPSDFKMRTIDSYKELNSATGCCRVIETYGQMAPDTSFGSCRVSKQLPRVDRASLESYIKYCFERDIEFNYVVNATCMENDELTVKGFKKAKSFFRMLNDIGVSSVTLALPSLMEIAKYAAPGLKIKASTACRINSPLKAQFYEDLGVARIVLDEDIHRRFDTIAGTRKVFSGDIEVIINSFCCMDCPYRMFDYNSFSHSHIDKETYGYYTSRCRTRHIDFESFMKLNWIRPEDLHYYYDSGVTYFKMQGRTTVNSGDPVKAVKCYMDGYYDGDLVRLLELFSTKRPLAIGEVEIDNRKLDGFFARFFENPRFCTKLCKECGYCRGFGEESISPTDRMILDLAKTVNRPVHDEFPEILDKC